MTSNRWIDGRAGLVAGQTLLLLLFFAIWEISVTMLHIKPVILPPPSAVFAKMWQHRFYLIHHTWPTLIAISAGFGIALVSGFLIAVAIAYSRPIRRLIYPFLVTAQVLPKVAFAPLFLIWFGFGLLPKVIIAAMVAFFPIVINTAKGLTSVEPELLQYMRSLGATWFEIFIKISLPWSLPYIFAALKISITLAVVGAVIGEFVASDVGLGYVVSYANISLDTELMFAGIIVLSVLGIFLFLVILLLEYLFLSWHANVSLGPETL